MLFSTIECRSVHLPLNFTQNYTFRFPFLNNLMKYGVYIITCRLKLGTCITTIPTIGFNVETVTVTVTYGRRFHLFGCWGGGKKIRPLKKHYYQNSGAIVVIVDSTDRERFPEVVRTDGDKGSWPCPPPRTCQQG